MAAQPSAASAPLPAPPGPAPASQPPRRRGRLRGWRARLLLLVGVWATVVVALLVSGVVRKATLTDEKPAASAACTERRTTPATAPPADLVVVGKPTPAVPFGRRMVLRTRHFDYDAADPAALAGRRCLAVRVGTFFSDTGQDELDPKYVDAQALVQSGRVALDVTFDRRQDRLGPPGSYTGVVSLVDEQVGRVDVPVTVTMSYPIWQWPFAMLVFLLVPAIGYVWLLKGSFLGRENVALSLRDFHDWVFGRNHIIATGTGAAAALGIFSGTYLRSPTWGSDVVQAITLFGSMFAAFVASATAVTAAGADGSTAHNR